MELNKNTLELLEKYIDTLDVFTSKETAIRNLLMKALELPLEDRIKNLEYKVSDLEDKIHNATCHPDNRY